MKTRMIMAACFILAVACFSGIAEQNDSVLRSQVESLYNRKDAAQQAKDFEALMSLHAGDYQVIPAGIDRTAFQDIVKKILPRMNRYANNTPFWRSTGPAI